MRPESLESGAGVPDTAGRVELSTPAGRAWQPVMRLVLGGIANHLDLRFEELDDLQLALERLLVEAGPSDVVHLAFEVTPGGVRTTVGPLRETVIAEALQGPPPAPGELSLRRILEAVVDSYGVEVAGDGALRVRLDNVTRRP
jgi:hypothetical protein